MNTGKKYHGNALLVTVIISLVIFMLMSAVVALAFYHRLNEQRAEKENMARNNLYSAINFVLGDTAMLAQFPQDINAVNIERDIWGFCRLAAINSAGQKRAFLYGAEMRMDACLYLADQGRPLSVTGKTVLTGDVYLPSAGYIGTIPGNVKSSSANLPAINLAQPVLPSGRTALIPDSLTQSFFSPTHVIYNKKPITLKSILKGRIIVQSDSAITVTAQSKLENIILIAPTIRFLKGFSGRVQAFASKEIIAEAGCRFSYPSCFAGSMYISENCTVDGMLVSPEAEIQAGTIINGIVYVTGHTTLQGKVNGMVLTGFFRYRTATTEYENFLTDAEINRDNLSQWFIAPPVFTPSSPGKIMQWLE